MTSGRLDHRRNLETVASPTPVPAPDVGTTPMHEKGSSMNVQRIIGRRQLAIVAALGLGTAAAWGGTAYARYPASPSASVASGTLTVLGTHGDDSLAIGVVAGDPDTLEVDLGNGTVPQRFDRNTFDTISVFLHRGDDQFQVLPGVSLVSESLFVVGGRGDDIIVGGDGNDNLSGGRGDDDVQGRDGTDLIFGNAGRDTVNGNRGNDTEILGAGNDTALWNPGEANDVIDGGRGTDSLAFNGANVDELMSLRADGSRAVFQRNVANIRMDLNRVERLDLATLGGADQVLVDDMTGTAMRVADVDLSSSAGTGDGLVDTVTVNGTNTADRIRVDADGATVEASGLHAATRIAGSDLGDQLVVQARGGNDKVDVGAAAEALMGVSVDLGTGQS
jgi:hypothetical protein